MKIELLQIDWSEAVENFVSDQEKFKNYFIFNRKLMDILYIGVMYWDNFLALTVSLAAVFLSSLYKFALLYC